MVTGGFRVVLLAVCLAVAASSVRDNNERSICQRSAIYMVIRELHRCTTDSAGSMPSLKAIKDRRSNVTVAEIARFVQDYCTVAVPNGVSCFQDKIRECNSTFQAKVSQLAERGVGLLCQPGGAGLNPAFSDVLDGIDDEDLLPLRSSRPRCLGTRMSLRTCHRQLPGPHEAMGLPLDELVPWMQGAAGGYVTCSLRAHKMAKDTCPYWKVAFVADVRFLLKRNLLGVQMPEELALELEM